MNIEIKKVGTKYYITRDGVPVRKVWSNRGGFDEASANTMFLRYGGVLVQPDNEIWYTSTNKRVVTPNNANVFGANLVSNTYKNGRGILKFDGNVTAMGQEAFKGDSIDPLKLVTISIPKTVTSIGQEAFRNCRYLTAVVLPESVTSISNDAFRSCEHLTSVVIPNTVTALGSGVFVECFDLTSFTGEYDKISADSRCIVVSGSLKAFAQGGLTKYVLPQGITSIEDNVLFNLPDIEGITIPNTVTSLGANTLRYCTDLKTVTVPASVTSLGANSFRNTPNLTSATVEAVACPNLGGEDDTPPFNEGTYTVYVPNQSLYAYRWGYGWSNLYNEPSNKKRLQAIQAPSDEIWYTSTDGNVVNLYNGHGPFGANVVSNTYTNGKGVIKFDGPVNTMAHSAFYGRDTLNSITFPAGITSIGNYVFRGTSLTSVAIPPTVTTIGSEAFAMITTLASAVIPESVTSIDAQAFLGCSNLMNVLCDPYTPPTLGIRVFYNVNANCRILVYGSKVNTYKSAWTDYTSMIQSQDAE